MPYREISQTINLNEGGAGDDLPVTISGEIEVRKTDIATDSDDAADAVHELASQLDRAITDVIGEYSEGEDGPD